MLLTGSRGISGLKTPLTKPRVDTEGFEGFAWTFPASLDRRGLNFVVSDGCGGFSFVLQGILGPQLFS